GGLVITSSAFHPERFGGGDLDVVDVARVPERFENRVGEAEHQNVLGRFFSEKVIDPISLFFTEGIADHAIQLASGIEVAAKRLLHNHPGPAAFTRFVQTDSLEMFQDRLELLRRDCEIKKPVAARAALLIDLIETFGQRFETGLIAEITLMIKNRLAEGFPDFVAHGLAGKFADGLFHFAPKVLIALFASGETDNGDGWRQFAISAKIVKRWQQFAVREIAGRAENHNAARLRHRAGG